MEIIPDTSCKALSPPADFCVFVQTATFKMRATSKSMACVCRISNKTLRQTVLMKERMKEKQTAKNGDERRDRARVRRVEGVMTRSAQDRGGDTGGSVSSWLLFGVCDPRTLHAISLITRLPLSTRAPLQNGAITFN